MSEQLTIDLRLPHWLYVAWLRAVYWPLCTARMRIERAWRVQKKDHYIVTFNELIALTERLNEHPDDWDGPCCCATCRSYAGE